MSSAQRSASLRASICVRCSRLLARIAPIAFGEPTANTKAAQTVSLSAWVRLCRQSLSGCPFDTSLSEIGCISFHMVFAMRQIETGLAKYEASIIRPDPDVSAVGPSLSLNASHSGNDKGRIGSTDPARAGPIDPRRRHRRAQHGGLARTVPSGSRSAAERRNGRRKATRTRPRLPSRSSGTASSTSRRGRALAARYAADRATVRQKKTGRPVRFELTEQTR
jgi:hypothetical protein